MLAQPFSSEYSNTISSLGQPHAQPPHASPSYSPPAQPSSLPSADDLPTHPIVQQYLVNSNAASLHPPTLTSGPPYSSSSSLPSAAGPLVPSFAPPTSSDFFTSPDQDRPYFLFCLSCSSPLSDVFHVTDGDDAHVTVDAVYSDSVLSASQPTVVAAQGVFYGLSCQRCGSPIGRYYRFTSPGAINKCNMFSLDVQCVGVRLLGSATVKGEQYVEETGIATRLTQLMLTTAAVKEEMDELRGEGRKTRDELDKTRTRMRRMEQKLRQLIGDGYDDEEGEERMEAEAAATSARTITAQTQPFPSGPTNSTNAASSPPFSIPAGPSSTSTTAGTAKKRGRPRKAALAIAPGDNGRQQEKRQERDEAAFVPAVKRKERAAAAGGVHGRTVDAGRDETEDELEEDGRVQQPKSATNGAKRGRQRQATLTPPR